MDSNERKFATRTEDQSELDRNPGRLSGSLPLILANRIRFTISGRTLGVKGQKSFLANQQIGQTKQGKELRRVLAQPLETFFLQAEDILDVMEAVFTDRTCAGFGLLHSFQPGANEVAGIEVLSLARYHGHFQVNRQILGFRSLLDAMIARGSPVLAFFTMQRRSCLGDVWTFAAYSSSEKLACIVNSLSMFSDSIFAD